MAVPNFLVAGAARSGTSALMQVLGQHPDVFVSSPKEMHFYAHAGHPVTYRGPGDELMMNARIVDDPDAFHALFDAGRSARRRGDGSVSTLVRPEVSIPNIRRHADEDVRIVVMLREPVARAHSSFLYLRGRGHEPLERFEDALEAEPQRRRDGFHHMWWYRGLSRYREQLEPFVDAFGERLRVVPLDDYKADPGAVLASLCRFLGLDDAFDFDASADVNRGGEPKSRALVNLMNAARARPVVQASVKALTSARFRERVRSRNLVRPSIDEGLRDRLAHDFADDRRYVESVLGRELAAWHR